MIKHVFFDFDGVLAESVNVKTEAFRQLYLPFGSDIAEKVVAHHLAHGGMSRFEKIRIYHENFLGSAIKNEDVLVWADRFSKLVLDGVINAPAVNGSLEFLNKFQSEFNMYIITGTPTIEIHEILKKRSWESYFLGAYGSPEKKTHWTEYLINENNLDRTECVFIGDATTDFDAATHSGIHFILRQTDENKCFFSDYTGPIVSDLTTLKQTIELL